MGKLNIDEFFDNLKAQAQSNFSSVTLGHELLDDAVGGVEDESLIFIIAPKSRGKTVALINMAVTNALAGKRVAYWALDDGERATHKRLIACFTGLPRSIIKRGTIRTFPSLADEFKRVAKNFPTDNIEIFDRKTSLDDFIEWAKREKPDLIIVDTMSMLPVEGENLRFQAVQQVRTCKALAVDIGAVVVVAHHANSSSGNLTVNQQSEATAETKEVGSLSTVMLFMCAQGKGLHRGTITVTKTKDGELGGTVAYDFDGDSIQISYEAPQKKIIPKDDDTPRPRQKLNLTDKIIQALQKHKDITSVEQLAKLIKEDTKLCSKALKELETSGRLKKRIQRQPYELINESGSSENG